MARLVIRDVAIIDATGREPEGRHDVLIEDGRIAALAGSLEPRDEPRLDAAGGALFPGLHDHHIHLLALAAARRSVRGGPPAVTSAPELADALAAAGANAPTAPPAGTRASTGAATTLRPPTWQASLRIA